MLSEYLLTDNFLLDPINVCALDVECIFFVIFMYLADVSSVALSDGVVWMNSSTTWTVFMSIIIECTRQQTRTIAMILPDGD